MTLDDDVERLRAKKKSYEEFGEECGTELAKYSALLRIPSAMEEGQKGNRSTRSTGSDRS